MKIEFYNLHKIYKAIQPEFKQEGNGFDIYLLPKLKFFTGFKTIEFIWFGFIIEFKF